MVSPLTYIPLFFCHTSHLTLSLTCSNRLAHASSPLSLILLWTFDPRLTLRFNDIVQLNLIQSKSWRATFLNTAVPRCHQLVYSSVDFHKSLHSPPITAKNVFNTFSYFQQSQPASVLLHYCSENQSTTFVSLLLMKYTPITALFPLGIPWITSCIFFQFTSHLWGITTGNILLHTSTPISRLNTLSDSPFTFSFFCFFLKTRQPPSPPLKVGKVFFFPSGLIKTPVEILFITAYCWSSPDNIPQICIYGLTLVFDLG